MKIQYSESQYAVKCRKSLSLIAQVCEVQDLIFRLQINLAFIVETWMKY